MPQTFDEVEFPLDLAYGSKGGPDFNIELLETGQGFEVRIQRWRAPLHKFDASYAIRTPAALNTLLGFYIARQGGCNGFRFRDPNDNSSCVLDNLSAPTATDQQLVEIDSTHYQLVKIYSMTNGSTTWTFSRNITKPVSGTVLIQATGSTPSWAVDTTTGIVTLSSAPTAPVTGGFLFDVPSRFGDGTDEALQAAIEDFGYGSMDSIPINEIKYSASLSTGTETPLPLPVATVPGAMVLPSGSPTFPPTSGNVNTGPNNIYPITLESSDTPSPVKGGLMFNPALGPSSCPGGLASSYSLSLAPQNTPYEDPGCGAQIKTIISSFSGDVYGSGCTWVNSLNSVDPFTISGTFYSMDDTTLAVTTTDISGTESTSAAIGIGYIFTVELDPTYQQWTLMLNIGGGSCSGGITYILGTKGGGSPIGTYSDGSVVS